MSTKSINLRAFEIVNSSVTQAHSDLFQKLKNRLNSSIVTDRAMLLNMSDKSSQEQDLISFYEAQDGLDMPVFCVLLRASIDDNAQHIDKALFKQNTFKIDDIKDNPLGPGVIYKRHFYFTAYKNHIVTTLPGNITIKGLQTYLNWFLNDLYEINPKINSKKISELSDIENIKVRDPINAQSEGEHEKTHILTRMLRHLSREAVRNFITDTPNISEEQLEQMVSAELLLKFRRPKKNDPEALKKAYSAILKPVADLDNYQVKRRNSSTIYSGKDIVESKVVYIEELEKNRINERQLEQEMRKYIIELEKNA